MTDHHDVEKRLRYFNGQFLNNHDFIDEQKYHIDRQRRHNRLLHTPGIAEGLEVTAECGAQHVEVSPGTAIDSKGRQIVLTKKEEKRLYTRCGEVFVAISYHQEESDSATVGAKGETRWHEQPKIEIVEDRNALQSAMIVLARLEIDGDGRIRSHDFHVRHRAGVRISPEIELRNLTFASKDVHCSCWPALHFGAAHRIDLKGNLFISEHLGIGVDNPKNGLEIKGGAVIGTKFCERQIAPTNGLLIEGRVGIGNNSPGASLEVTGETKNENYAALDVTDCDGKSLLSVRNNGNIGIGTTRPGDKLHVSGGNIQLDRDSELFFADNGQIRSLDDNHRIVFNSSQDKMELREKGDLIFSPGATDGTQTSKVVMLANGNVGIGNTAPTVKLQVEGEIRATNLSGPGSDYAEWLPKLQEDEVIQEGDIAGVVGGKISKKTDGVHALMVVSSQPIIVGNMPSQENKHLYEKLAFMGQVRVKVRGKVQAGDYIVPSGLDDGIGIAVSTQKLNPAVYAQIVGTAWESSQEEGVKRVNVLVGLQSSYSWMGELLTSIQEQLAGIEALKTELDSLKNNPKLSAIRSQQAEIEALKTELDSVKNNPELSAIRTQQAEIEALKNELDSVKNNPELKAIRSQQAEIEALKSELDSVKNNPELKAIRTQQAEIEALKSELDSVKNNPELKTIQTQQVEIGALKTELDSVKNNPELSAIKTQQAEIETLKSELDSVKNNPELKTIQTQQAEIEALKAELNSVRNNPQLDAIQTQQAELETLKAELDSVRNKPELSAIRSQQAEIEALKSELNLVKNNPELSAIRTQQVEIETLKTELEYLKPKNEQNAVRAQLAENALRVQQEEIQALKAEIASLKSQPTLTDMQAQQTPLKFKLPFGKKIDEEGS
ncbi:MAG TPA: hypothetical protein V6D33_02945 [Cyanophyceae cyanobacterium]